jgi:predicted aspartyl protease
VTPSRRGALLAAVLAALVTASCGLPSVGSQRGVTQHVDVQRARDGSTTVLLPVTVEGHGPYQFVLDTGASKSLISTTVASDIGLRRAGPSQPIQGVGGVERATPVRVTRWNTGSIELPPMVITAADLPSGRRGGQFQGLLGSDVWNAIGSFTLDYRTGTLTVNPG